MLFPHRTVARVARLLTLLSIGVLLLTCKAQVDLLPSATQSGQNTFGCLIDGKSYVPDGRNGFMAPKPIYGGFAYSGSNTIVIYLNTNAKDGKQVDLYVDAFKLGSYNFDQNTGIMPAALSPKSYGRYYSSDGKEYVTSAQHTGQIIITKADTATGLIAGTFHFTGVSTTGATVDISNGRFDINMRTLP